MAPSPQFHGSWLDFRVWREDLTAPCLKLSLMFVSNSHKCKVTIFFQTVTNARWHYCHNCGFIVCLFALSMSTQLWWRDITIQTISYYSTALNTEPESTKATQLTIIKEYYDIRYESMAEGVSAVFDCYVLGLLRYIYVSSHIDKCLFFPFNSVFVHYVDHYNVICCIHESINILYSTAEHLLNNMYSGLK